MLRPNVKRRDLSFLPCPSYTCHHCVLLTLQALSDIYIQYILTLNITFVLLIIHVSFLTFSSYCPALYVPPSLISYSYVKINNFFLNVYIQSNFIVNTIRAHSHC
jgi:hypothetical protein